MRTSLLTIAGTMFLVPMIIMTAWAIVGDIPGQILTIGGWSMAFSLIVAALGVFVGMNDK